MKTQEQNLRYAFIRNPSPALLREIMAVYRREGWWTEGDDASVYRRIVNRSFCFMAVFSGRELAAFSRAISDGVSDAYIQDVVVRPEFRRRGIASEMVKRITVRLSKAGIGWIGLVSVNNRRRVYSKNGFKVMKGFSPMRFESSASAV